MPSFCLLCVLTPLCVLERQGSADPPQWVLTSSEHNRELPPYHYLKSMQLATETMKRTMSFRSFSDTLYFIVTPSFSQAPLVAYSSVVAMYRPSKIDKNKGKKWEIGREKVSRCETAPISVVLCPSYFFFIPKGLTHISFAFVPIIHLPVGDWLGERGFNLFLPCSPCLYIYLASC